MLENIRKYTGLFIVMLVLIFIGLIFIGNSSGRGGPGSGPVVVKTDTRSYSAKELQKANQQIRLAQRLANQSNQLGGRSSYYGSEAALDIFRYLGTLEASSDSEELKRHLVHRSNFEQAKKDFGIAASEDEIQLYQREKIFTNSEGIFDDQAYTTFVDKGLKGLGMTINDVNDFIGDLIAFKALGQILSAGVIADKQASQENALADGQQFSLSVLSLDLETFKKEITPTEEEVKTYWEENKGRYLTEAKRRLTYFTATPDFETALAKKKEEEATKEKTPTEEAAEAEGSEDTEKNITLTPAERKKLIDELGLVIDDDILVTLEQQIEGGAPKANLEEQAKKYGYETKTTELLPISELPKEILGSIRGTRTLVEQELATMIISDDNPMDSLSETFGIGTENWLLFRIDEAEEPTVKTFAEAQENAQTDYIQEKAEQALQEGIESAREAVAKAIADGSTLEKAAEAQALKMTEHEDLAANTQLAGEPNTRDIFRLASQTKTGEFSKGETIEPLKDQALFVYVKEREFVESPQNKQRLERAVESQQVLVRNALLDHWFRAAYDNANVEIVRN